MTQANVHQAIDNAVTLASQAAPLWAEASVQVRARLLRGLAQVLEAHQADLVAIADEESHLGAGRLNSEVARTAFQLRGFAEQVEAGAAHGKVADEAIAGAPPAGRPQLTRVLRPLGPVAKCSASNFPFAFSVLGGDAASVLAAGCPVVVKAHSGHPRLSVAVYELARQVLVDQGLPEGLITMVEGASRGAGGYLVQHPSRQSRLIPPPSTHPITKGRRGIDVSRRRLHIAPTDIGHQVLSAPLVATGPGGKTAAQRMSRVAFSVNPTA